MRHSILVVLALSFCFLQSQPILCAETPGELEAKGAEALLLSQSQPDAIVPAAIFYGKASAAYVLAGDDAKAAEANSYLYWCKKKMTSAQMDTFLKKGESGASEAVASLKALESKVVPVSESKMYIDRADAFAKKYPNDFLLVAIRYFEVADRFPETAEGRSAMQLSLAAMQKVVAKAKPSEYKPAATDGKIFIQSDPPGASIIFVQGEIKRDTGKKTPGLVQLPLGAQTVELELKGYKPGTLTVTVDDKSIAKPSSFKLNPVTAQVEILFDADWQVFVDQAVASQKTPCIVEIPMGAHTVFLAKEGFRDIAQPITLKSVDRTSLEPKAKPQAGVSAILSMMAEKKKKELKEFCGIWKYSRTDGAGTSHDSVEFKMDGTYVRQGNKLDTGKFSIEGEKLVMTWDRGAAQRLNKVDKNTYSNARDVLKR